MDKITIADATGEQEPVEYGNLVDQCGRTAQEFLKEHFEYCYCEECYRDKEDHTAVPFLGNWFARCDKEPLTEAQIKQRDKDGTIPA